MNFRRISGILIAVIGIALFFFSDTLAITITKEGTPTNTSRPRLIGRRVARAERANATNQAAQKYEHLANTLDDTSFALILIGACLIGVSFIPRKNHH